MEGFVGWCNAEHLHNTVRFVTSETHQTGHDKPHKQPADLRRRKKASTLPPLSSLFSAGSGALDLARVLSRARQKLDGRDLARGQIVKSADNINFLVRVAPGNNRRGLF